MSTDPAKQLNADIRKELVEMAECTGRKDLADQFRVMDLVQCVGMLFAELDAATNHRPKPKTRSASDGLQIKDLQRIIADNASALARLNARVLELNLQIDELTARATRKT